jgi:penicillin-binding protein 1C
METLGSHGTGLALGNAEVSLEEMVCGFSAFPRGGSPAALTFIEGEKPAMPEPVMSSYAAWIIADILSDRSSRFAGFGPAPVLATPFESMFKTGTANQFQHIWALGATKRFTVGVWMGNFTGETVIGSTGSSIPARIAAKLLGALEKSADIGKDRLGSPMPQGLAELQICALSGMAAGPYCTGSTREWLQREKIKPVCSWHTGAGLLYPPEYQAWLAERFRVGRISYDGSGSIRTPVSGSVHYIDPSLPPDAQALRIETSGFSQDALLYANGELLGSPNYAGVYAFPLSKGRHRITVEDPRGFSSSVDFEVR